MYEQAERDDWAKITETVEWMWSTSNPKEVVILIDRLLDLVHHWGRLFTRGDQQVIRFKGEIYQEEEMAKLLISKSKCKDFYSFLTYCLENKYINHDEAEKFKKLFEKARQLSKAPTKGKGSD
jgi:hypothetical protein